MTTPKRRKILHQEDDDTDQLLHAMFQRAEGGDIEAQYWLAACYATGDILPKDESKAVEWYTRAAEKGHAEAQYNLGTMVVQGEGTRKNLKKGIWWMEQAVANGYQYSAHVLAIFYDKGSYGIKPNPKKAAYWKDISEKFKDSA